MRGKFDFDILSICYYYFLYFYYRELLENSIAPKQQRLSASDQAQLIELLILKDSELKDTIKVSIALWSVYTFLFTNSMLCAKMYAVLYIYIYI